MTLYGRGFRGIFAGAMETPGTVQESAWAA